MMNLQKPSLTKPSLIKTIGKYIQYPIIIAVTIFLTKYLSPPREKVESTIEYVEPKTYEDINNKIHNVIEEKNLNIHSNKEYADSLANLLNIKTKELEKVTSSLNKMDIKIVEKPTIINTTKDTAYSLTKEDDWIKIHAYLSKDTGSITFSARDSLTITSYTKKRLFGSTSYVDIQHANPYIKTEKAYSINFQQKYPKLTIGPYVGYGYSLETNKFSPSIGISLQVPLIKIMSKK